MNPLQNIPTPILSLTKQPQPISNQLQIFFEISHFVINGPRVLGESYISSIPKYNRKSNKCNFFNVRFPYTDPSKVNYSTDVYYWLHMPHINFDHIFKYPANWTQNHVILGPIVIPNYWAHFPNPKNHIEANWTYYLSNIFAYTTQTSKIKNRLIKLSHTENLSNKYIIAPFCKYFPDIKYTLKDYKDREIDIIFYLKFSDTKIYKPMAKKLQSKLESNNYTLYSVKSGRYRVSQLMKRAANAKYVVYFSTFDNGPSAIIELMAFGCYCFVLQPEFLFNNNGLYVPEMLNDTETAFKKINDMIQEHKKNPPNYTMLGDMNRDHYSCYRSLDVLCDQIYDLRNHNENHS